MMAKSSTKKRKNQQKRQKYDALANESRAQQRLSSGAPRTNGNDGFVATLDAVRAVAARRTQRQPQAAKHSPSSPKPTALVVRTMLKELPEPVSTRPQASIPSPMVLAKPHQLKVIQDDRPRCAIPRCKERDDICPPHKVEDCLEQRAYREALDRFIT